MPIYPPPHRYLVADYSLRCHDADGLDAEWQQMLPFALFMVVFFVIGVPLLLLVLLVRNRAAIKTIGRAFDEALAEKEVLEVLGESIDIDKARALYRQVDIDHSGSIGFPEFAKFWLNHNEGEDGTSDELAKMIDTIQQESDVEVIKTLGRKVRALSKTRGQRSIRRIFAEDDNAVVVDGARGEGKGGTENQEINISTETKGAAEGAQDTRPSSSDEAAHTSRSDQKVVRIAQGSFIVAKELAAVEEDGMEMMLGMLWMAYKPEQYYFDIINIMFKLVLYATLVFFNYGSQLQIGTALLLCVGRLALHAQFAPYREKFDNVFDYVTLVITALFGLGGIMLQSIDTFKNLAILKGDKRGTAASKISIHAVELVLNIMVATVFVVFTVFCLQSFWQKREMISSVLQSVMQRVVTRCPCFLRCMRRCPACCRRCNFSGRRHTRATTSPASTSPATDVEMMPCQTKGIVGKARGDSPFSVGGGGGVEDSNDGGGLAFSNPLYPHMSQRANSEGGSRRERLERMRTTSATGRDRRDTLNPTFPDSPEMVALTRHESNHTILKRRMSRTSLTAKGDGGEGIPGDGEEKGDSGVASGSDLVTRVDLTERTESIAL